FKLLNPIYFILLIDLLFYGIWQWRKRKNIVQCGTSTKRKPLFLSSIFMLSLAMILFSVFSTKNQLITNAAYVAETKGIFTYEIVTVIQKFSKPPEINKSATEIQAQIERLKDYTQPLTEQYTGALEG